MNKQIQMERLTKLGLSEIEAELYLHLLQFGPKTPLELSRDTDINRTKIYRCIDVLFEKKLIEDSLNERGKRIKAASPDNLELLVFAAEEELKAKRNTLSDTVLDLSQVSVQNLPGFEVKHYRGEEGLKQMLWNQLKAKEILFFAYTSLDKRIGEKFATKHLGEIIKRGITLKQIGNKPALAEDIEIRRFEKAGASKGLFAYKQISTDDLEIKDHGIVIYNDTVSILNWKDNDYVGIETINKGFAEVIRKIFRHYWKLAK